MGWFQAENEITWEPSDRTLPMRSVQRGSRAAGIFSLLFGLAWTGVIVASIVGGTMKTGVDVPMTILMLLFGLPGVGAVAFGLVVFTRRREVFLTGDEVQVVERRLGKDRSWRTPVSEHPGVVKRFVHHRSDRGSRTWYTVALAHTDPTREILLFCCDGRAGAQERWNAAWREFAQLLGRPPLEQTDEGVVDVAGLGNAPGAPNPVDDATRPGEPLVARGLRFASHDDGWAVEHRHGPLVAVIGALVAAALAAGAYLASHEGDPMTPWICAMAVVAGLLSTLAFVRGGSTETLALQGSRLVHRGRGGSARPVSLELGGLRRISVKGDGDRPSAPSSIWLEGESTTIRFGEWLSQSAREDAARWLRRTLMRPDAADADGAPSRRVLPLRRVEPRALVLAGSLVLAFFALLAIAMDVAFREEPSEPPVARSEVPASPASRNDLVRAWAEAYNTGHAQVYEGGFDSAERNLRTALGLSKKLDDPDRYERPTLVVLAMAREGQGRYADAASLYGNALTIQATAGASNDERAWSRARMARAFWRAGDVSDAEPHFVRALEQASDPDRVSWIRREYARYLDETGRPDEARALLTN